MEDDLKKREKMEDNLKINKKWKTTSKKEMEANLKKKMEDDLKKKWYNKKISTLIGCDIIVN
jgi:hypothetical protein